MRFLFLAPLPSAFGEALQGARLAEALVARGHTVHVAAPSIIAPAVPPGIPFIGIDAAFARLDTEIERLCSHLRIDVLVLVDASAVDKACRALRFSRERIVAAAPRCVSIDCWNLVSPPRAWDYGPTSEPLDPWLLENTAVIRPCPIARVDAPGAYAALPQITARHDPAATRERFGLPPRGAVIAWPMARWQLPESHDNAELGRLAARLPQLLAPSLATLGGDTVIAHVSPAPLAAVHRFPGYHHIEPLPAHEFDALISLVAVLLSFNAAATSLTTALGLGVPTVLCAPRDPHGRTWAWPLRLDHVLSSTVANNPFYDTMTIVDSVGDELEAALRALVTEGGLRDERRAAQARYRDALAALPEGADRLLAEVT